jgi:hypothetical protein
MRAQSAIVGVFLALAAAGCSESNDLSEQNDDGGDAPLVDSGGNAPSCQCQAQPDGIAAPAEIVHQNLACLCGTAAGATACATTLAQVSTGHCPPALFTIRSTGCGKVTYQDAQTSGQAFTFDLATGKLVGVLNAGDVAWGECNVHSYAYGDTNDTCPVVERCKVCGGGNLPICD